MRVYEQGYFTSVRADELYSRLWRYRVTKDTIVMALWAALTALRADEPNFIMPTGHRASLAGVHRKHANTFTWDGLPDSNLVEYHRFQWLADYMRDAGAAVALAR